MKLSDRKKKILRTVIDRYIETAEPVGSKAVLADCGLSVSSATIRNEMADLEELGLLEQPHTSAGRIPTALGYRIYVNELMAQHRLSVEETEQINQGLRRQMQQLDRVLSDAGKLTSELTNYPAYALSAAVSLVTPSRYELIYVDRNTFIIVIMLSNNTVKNKLVHLPVQIDQPALVKLSTQFNASFTGITEDKITPQLISAAERATNDTIGLVGVIAGFTIEVLNSVKTRETYVAGTSHIFEHPEFQDVGKAQKLLNYLSNDGELLQLPAPEEVSGTKITIGPENLAEELKDSSVVVARYNIGDDMQGLIGVVGPTRMDYSKVSAKLSYIANGMSRLLSGNGALPLSPGSGPKNDDEY